MVIQLDFRHLISPFRDTELPTAMNRLSTGRRINSSSDDPSGMALSQQMRAQIQGLNQAFRNTQEGISLLQVAEAGANEIAQMLQRIREILVQAASDMLAEVETEHLQMEADLLTSQIDMISRRTTFNSMPLLTGDMGHPHRLVPVANPSQFTGLSGASFLDSLSQIQPLSSGPPPLPDVHLNINALVDGISGAGWSFDNGTLTITSDQIFRIVGTGETNRQIDIQSDATIILENVHLNADAGDAMHIGDNNVTLWLEGNNILETHTTAIAGREGGAGIGITSGNLIIDGSGALLARASDSGVSQAFAGIGSGRHSLRATPGGYFTGSVVIRGGTVHAYGGSYSGGGGGAGIGGSSNRPTTGATVSIEGGTVRTTGGTGAAGIGGGSGWGMFNTGGQGLDVTVSGGFLTAIGGAAMASGYGGAGIGTGARTTGDGGSLNVTGGIVNVHAGARSAAVGGAGANSGGANVNISGGLLEVMNGWIGGSLGNANQGTTTVSGGNLSIHYATGSGGSNPMYYINRSDVTTPVDAHSSSARTAYRVQIFLEDTSHTFNPHQQVTYYIGGRQVTATADSFGRLFFYLPEDASDGFEGAATMVMWGDDFTGQFQMTTTYPHGHQNTLILTRQDAPPPPPPPPDDDFFERPFRPHIPGRPLVFQVGANSYQVLFQHIGALTLETLGMRDADGNNTFDIRGRSARAVSQMIDFMDDVLLSVSAEIGHLGASQNRLHHISNQLELTSLNHTDAYINITDADMAREQSRVARRQLLQQNATIMIAQTANLMRDSASVLLNSLNPINPFDSDNNSNDNNDGWSTSNSNRR